jgi:hypothetical protein
MNWWVSSSGEKKLQATIVLEYAGVKTAKAIAAAVSPDNSQAPLGLVVSTVLCENKVVTEISLEGKIGTLIATIDDLLENACAAEKTLLVLKSK